MATRVISFIMQTSQDRTEHSRTGDRTVDETVFDGTGGIAGQAGARFRQCRRQALGPGGIGSASVRNVLYS